MKTIYNCLIVDDEPIARKIIKNYIAEMDMLLCVAEVNNAIDALKILSDVTIQIDIVFLDINMPSLTGIDMVKMSNKLPQIIFTTAYSDYAVESYELNAVDYLLKPFSYERFIKAVQKAKINLESNVKKNPELLQVRAEGKMFYIEINDIIFCEAMRNYTRIYLKNGQRLMTLVSLSKFENSLMSKSKLFIRIHRSFIISRNHIQATKSNEVLMMNKTSIPIGNQFKNNFFGMIADG